MKKVFAVIVTFKRPEMLRTCLASLMGQRDYGLSRIHVVVNSSDSETEEVINSFREDEDFLTFDRYDNPGPAGGFYHGLQRFLNEECEYAWLMDDDVVVAPSCLQELLLCSADHQYVYPKVLKKDGEEVVSFGWWGVLLARSVVVTAGLPIPELFYWAEDTEYLQNRIMRQHGVVPFRCKSAAVTHLHLRHVRHPSWYYYYAIRNTLYYRTYIAGYTKYRFKRTLFLFAHSIFTILFREQRKFKKLWLLTLGTYHGLIGRIGKLVDPELNK